MMIDEKTVGETAEPEATPTESAEPEVAAEKTSKDPYDGKSADDLKAMLRDAQKQIGKQSTEVGEVRKLREEMESLKQAVTRPQFQQPYDAGMTYQAPPPPKEDEFDFSDVPKSIDKRIEKKLGALEQRYTQSQRQQDAIEAQSNFERTKKDVYQKNSALYKGIEPVVEQHLFNAWKTGAIGKNQLSDPDTWRIAAVAIREINGTLGDVYSRQVVKPTQMETPQGRRQVADDGDEIVFSREDRRFMEDNDLSEKEAADALREAKSMRNSGGIRWAR
jgi:hypothetical protein